MRRGAQGADNHELAGPLPEPGASEGAATGRRRPNLLRPIAETLQALGVERALVVHGSGLDEVALHGFTRAVSLRGSILEDIEITPEQAGLKRIPVQQIAGGAPAENAARIAAVLGGSGGEADTAVVALNAGALLMTAGKAATLREGIGAAFDAIRRRRLRYDASGFRRGEPWLKAFSDKSRRRKVKNSRADSRTCRSMLCGPARHPRAAASPTSLAGDGARFILEIKKASPSAGAIRPDADPAMLARGYAGVADALSVLCDGPHFGGSLHDLAVARQDFEGPILAKDFFLDLRQVAEARIAGADAILVMLSLLDDAAARSMIAEAHRFGMDALVEVHDEAEMRRALALGSRIIGINNRDLRDLSVDLSTTERLAKLAPDRLLVSESVFRPAPMSIGSRRSSMAS